MDMSDVTTAADGLEPEVERPSGGPKLGFVGWLRYLWRQLTSMRVALYLLLLLAIAAIPGSVWPQRSVDPSGVRTYFEENPSAAEWIDRIGGFDLYASPWFSAIYLLLMVSLVGCLVPRFRDHLRSWRRPPARVPTKLSGMPGYQHVILAEGQADEVLARAERLFRKRRYRIRREPNEISAENGYFGEAGNLMFHVSLLGFLMAAAVKTLWGFSGQAIIVEDETFANSVVRYDTFESGARFDSANLDPFQLTVRSLRVKFEESVVGQQFGAPRFFEADIEVQESPEAKPRVMPLQVNRPISVSGTNIYLAGNGYAVDVTVRDGQGDIAYAGPVIFRPQDAVYTSIGAIQVPDAKPTQLGFSAVLLPTAAEKSGVDGLISIFPDARNPRVTLTAYTGDLGMDDGIPRSIYLLNTEKLDQVREGDGIWKKTLKIGDSASLPNGQGTITIDGVRRFVALDIARDPSGTVALIASVLLIVGLVISLYIKRRRIWVRVSATQLEIAGLAHREDATLDEFIESLVGKIAPETRSPFSSEHPSA